MGDVEGVDADAGLFLPGAGVVGDGGRGEVVELARVDEEGGGVDRAGHVVGGEEVVEEPLFAELGEIRGEDGDGEGVHAAGLVDGQEEIFHFERFNLEVACVVGVFVRAGINVGLGVDDIGTVDDAADAFDFDVFERSVAVKPFSEGEGDIDGFNGDVKLRIIDVFLFV